MRQVPIREIHAGMVLGEPAFDLMGNPLLESGTVLLPDHLRILRAWGVRYAAIDETASAELPAAAPAEIAAAPAETPSRRRRSSTRIFRRESQPPPEAAGGDGAPEADPLPPPPPTPSPGEQEKALAFMFELHQENRLMRRIHAVALRQLQRRHPKDTP